METTPRAILHLEFAADGSIEYSWPRGDMHFLRTAFRNLAAAVLTDTRERMIPVERARTRCPICDRPDFCLIAPDRSKAICMRIDTDGKPVDMGSLGEGWLHVLDGSLQATQDRPQAPSRPRPEPADRDTLHRAYSAILGAGPQRTRRQTWLSSACVPCGYVLLLDAKSPSPVARERGFDVR